MVWLRCNIGLPLLALIVVWVLGALFAKDNHEVFFAVFGAGDPLLIGFLILVGVIADSDFKLQDAGTLTKDIKRLFDFRELLFYASVTALVFSVVAKFFALSPSLTAQNLENLVALMSAGLAGLFLCVCVAIWLKRFVLKHC